MAAETTAFTPATLERFVAGTFGIRRAEYVGALGGGVSNCHLLDSPQGRLVLKEMPAWMDADGAAKEPALCDHLRERGVPVATFIAATDGSYCVAHAGHVCTLTRYVDGDVLEPNTAPPWLLTESARLLGTLHRELAALPRLPDGMGADWFSSWTPAAGCASYGDFLRDHLTAFPAPAQAQVQADIQWKLTAIPRLAPIDFARLTRTNTHGDYKIQNMVIDPAHRRVAAIIDIAGCVHPVVWEIVRSYAHADPEAAAGNLSARNLIAYVGTYLAVFPLSPYDLAMLPHFWLQQLVRANYHGEYLSMGEGHRDESLRFASWSTQVCRWLAENADDLGADLVAMLGQR